jgi:ribosomal-protein-alanine N-acetyltransferase
VRTPFLAGKLVCLRGLQREDLEGAMLHWTDDREVTRYLFRGAYPAHLEQAEREYEAMLNSTTDVELAIIDRETEAHIGITGIHSINWIARSGEFRILIGEKECWGKGYGTEATQLMAAYGFEVLNLHKIWLGVNSEHVGAVKAYEKAGFIRGGELRDEIYRNSRYYNAIRMSMLQDEYQRLKLTWDIAEEIQKQFRA